MAVIVKRSDKFKPLYEPPAETNLVICIGGRGGMKTYEVSKYCAFSATRLKKRVVVVRDEKALIKESILNEIWERYETANRNGVLNRFFVKNETELKCKESGRTLVYTKGFRASDGNKKANLKGASDIDIAIIEEGEDITDEDKFNTFVDSLRKEGCIVIIMLNTPHVGHFLLKHYFTTKPVPGEDGYFEVIPKNIPGFVCIQTGYEDNPYLPKHIVERYEGYGNPEHHLYNKHYYLTAIRGFASTGKKGQIFTKAKPIKLSDYLAIPAKELFGQDFGNPSPAGLIGVKIVDNNVYTRQLNYDPMSVLDLGILYSRLRFNKTDKIICDSAEPETIEQLQVGWKRLPPEMYSKYPQLATGFNCIKAEKPPGSVQAGISALQGVNLFICEESTDFWDEIANYCWDVDKNNNPTDEPIDDHNHLIDPLRYVYMYERGGKMFGI